MKILVDADACPVKEIIINIAKKYNVDVWMFVDTSHILKSDYAKVFTVDKANDSVDIHLANNTDKGDVVVTQDYGVAAMILGKGAHGIHQSGKWYTNENIDQMLMERHLSKKARMGKGKKHLKGPSKRTDEDDRRFEDGLERLIEEIKIKNIAQSAERGLL